MTFSRLLVPTRRSFATGTRGARGHGWYVNYRENKGGRHLQGEYYDRESLQEQQAWNDAIFALGSQRIFLDVVVEPKQQSSSSTTTRFDVASLTGDRHRLYMDLASAVMPETTTNFVSLLEQDSKEGYIGTSFYRVEKNVGFCGGDVLTNTGRTGRAAQGSPLAYAVQEDPLVLWHLPGTLTMLVAKVGDIDSRFILCTKAAPHIDGIHRAFGRLSEQSLATIQDWERDLLTKDGAPAIFDLVIADGGLGDGGDVASKDDSSEAVA